MELGTVLALFKNYCERVRQSEALSEYAIAEHIREILLDAAIISIRTRVAFEEVHARSDW